MSTLKSHTLLATGLILAGLSAPMLAQAQSRATDNWGNAGDTIVKSGFDLCWRSGYWAEANAVPQCDPTLVKAPVAAPQAAPAPAPAPVAAPAPAPAPVAAAAPVAPSDAWKREITEKPVRLEGANFATGSSKLLKGGTHKLDEVAHVAKEHPEVELTVSGYTDSTGKAATNVKLSQARADAVKAYLEKKGVAANRITAKGYGAEHPLASNATAAGRAKNRRVEVNYVLKEESKVHVTQ